MIAMYKSHNEWSKNDMFDKLAQAHSIYLATQGRRAQTTEGMRRVIYTWDTEYQINGKERLITRSR